MECPLGEVIHVAMAEIKCAREFDDLLVAQGIGACVAVCAYDFEARVAAMAHVVLPDSRDDVSAPEKYADTAIPLLLQRMADVGASPDRIRTAVAGGAHLSGFHGSGIRLETGLRTSEAVKVALERVDLPVVAADLGGTAGRIVQFSADGRVCVKAAGRRERELVHLG